MSVPKLEVRGLQAGYGDVQVLWDVSFEVGPGETVCVVGSNGAGKTTALRCISGLLPARAGAVRVDGADLTNAAPAALLDAGIAHVPEGRRLFAAMSVRDNLLMGAYRRTDKAEIQRDLDRVYGLFPILAERRRQDAGTLSGGEQQMCAIARGLMARPSLLMIDELSLGLAPRAVELLTDALVDIRRTGLAVLLVEQDVMAALDIADRAVVIDRGRVTAAGPAKDLAGDPSIREAYMGIV
jgi:branched-chain amino acid transport system ATP-binding protein